MENHPADKLSTVDRILPLWILLAMAPGLGLGRVWPELGPALISRVYLALWMKRRRWPVAT
jgi:ACR3 family arsenite transporter